PSGLSQVQPTVFQPDPPRPEKCSSSPSSFSSPCSPRRLDPSLLIVSVKAIRLPETTLLVINGDRNPFQRSHCADRHPSNQ
ncbi:hypothetical protein HN51_061804, partial [Arachis hypogaea]